MKKTVLYSTRFRKDFKRYRNNPAKVAKLLEVVRLLENGMPVPPELKPHMLSGEYAGCMECHIGGDYLLVWLDEAIDVIRLLRLGSHSELFR